MPKPKIEETEKDFLKRCIPELIKEGREKNQSIAICYSIYRKEGTEEKSPKPKRKKLLSPTRKKPLSPTRKKPLSPRSKKNVFLAYY